MKPKNTPRTDLRALFESLSGRTHSSKSRPSKSRPSKSNPTNSNPTNSRLVHSTPSKPRSSESRPANAPPCGSLHPDDGNDPRHWNDDDDLNRESRTKSRARKQQGLAREAERVLSEVLAGELKDGALQDIEIAKVKPLDGGRLQVLVRGRDGSSVDSDSVLSRLKRLCPFLRQELARSIRRKKVPALIFQFAVDEEDGDE